MGHLIKSSWGRFIAGITAMLMLAWLTGAEFTQNIDWEPTVMFILAALAWAYSCLPDDAPAAKPAPAPSSKKPVAGTGVLVANARPLEADAPLADVVRYLREETGRAGLSDIEISHTLLDKLANPGARIHGWIRDSPHTALLPRSTDFWSEAMLDVRQGLVFEPVLMGDALTSYDPRFNWAEVRAAWPAQQ